MNPSNYIAVLAFIFGSMFGATIGFLVASAFAVAKHADEQEHEAIGDGAWMEK